MSKTKTVPLPVPVKVHGKEYRDLLLRRPTYDDYVACGGEPYTIGQSEDGSLFSIEKPEVIWAYAEAIIVEPSQLVLGDQDFSVAREVRKAILGFFQAPAAADEPSPTSPEISPSS